MRKGGKLARSASVGGAAPLKLPDVDVDAIQAAANEAVRQAIAPEANPKPAPTAAGLAKLQPHLNLDAANLPPPENEVREEERRARAWVWLLLPVALLGGAYLAWRWLATPELATPITVPTGTSVTALTPPPQPPETATPVETTPAVETSAPTTTAAPTPRTAESAITNVAPPTTAARPTADVSSASPPATQTPSPTPSGSTWTPRWH